MAIIGGPGDKENLPLPPDDKAETSKPVKAALHQLSQSSKDLENAGVQLSISAPPPTAEHVAMLTSTEVDRMFWLGLFIGQHIGKYNKFMRVYGDVRIFR